MLEEERTEKFSDLVEKFISEALGAVNRTLTRENDLELSQKLELLVCIALLEQANSEVSKIRSDLLGILEGLDPLFEDLLKLEPTLVALSTQAFRAAGKQAPIALTEYIGLLSEINQNGKQGSANPLNIPAFATSEEFLSSVDFDQNEYKDPNIGPGNYERAVRKIEDLANSRNGVVLANQETRSKLAAVGELMLHLHRPNEAARVCRGLISVCGRNHLESQSLISSLFHYTSSRLARCVLVDDIKQLLPLVRNSIWVVVLLRKRNQLLNHVTPTKENGS